MSNTSENLKTAFAGESQANRKYLAWGKRATEDGFPAIGKLFRAIAEAETIHAMAHLGAMGEVKNTAENLQAAIAGETYEYKEMYPPMLETAQKEEHRAKLMFGFAVKAEELHAKLFTKALEYVKAGSDMSSAVLYVCSVCGDIEFDILPDKCPICSAPKAKYKRVE